MEKLRVYYNPACSKCKKLKVLLANQDLEVDWVNYLENPLSEKALKELLEKMEALPSQIIRLASNELEGQTEEELLQRIVDSPVLLNRPIIEKQGMAFLCRPVDIITEKLPEYDWSEYL